MDSHIIDTNPLTGVTETIHQDNAEGRIYLAREQDVTEIVESNRRLYNLADGVQPFGDGKRMASIPIELWEELRKQGILDDPKAFRRWLNDPDNRAFRTLPGVI